MKKIVPELGSSLEIKAGDILEVDTESREIFGFMCPDCNKEFEIKVSNIPFSKNISCPTCFLIIGEIKKGESN